MAIMDPIADLLTRIRNANQRKHKSVRVPFSKTKNEVLKIMLEEGYIVDFKVEEVRASIKDFVVTLKYKGAQRSITGLKRISKPGIRVYSESANLPDVLGGFGIAIVSTSKGIMTAKNAKDQKLGGEILAYV
ncbi:MAG: 30S ribosomal protein S8 [Tenericutes bacterium]|nr:MAG: 30S ribosomal protein S8 [Mycoplasmatota bacterium]